MLATDLISKFGGFTEPYWFYNGEVELRYDDKEHAYFLVTDNGDLEKQSGVTQTCHIIDKSEVLIRWAVKQMSQKLIRTAPWLTKEGVGEYVAMLRADLEKWVLEAKDAHKEKLEDAGAVGHIAHNWIESYIKLILLGEVHLAAELRVILPYEERAAQACRAAYDWMDKHNVRWRATERKVYHREYKYAGTMDGLCVCDSCYDPKCCPNEFYDRLTIADWKTSNYLYMEYLFQTAAYQAAFSHETGEEVRDRWIIRLGKESGEFEAWHREPHNFEMDFGGFLDALKMTRTVAAVEQNLKERRDDIRAALKAERDAARAVKEAVEKAQKAEAKAKKQEERVARLREDCGKKNYKGKRAPSCKTREGEPCVKCLSIYGIRPLVEATSDKTSAKKPAKPKIKKERPEPKKPDYNSLAAIVMSPATGPDFVTRVRIEDGIETRTLIDRRHVETRTDRLLTAGKPMVVTIGESVSYHLGDDGHGNAIAIYEEDEETVKRFYENWGNENTTAAIKSREIHGSKERLQPAVPVKSAPMFNFFASMSRK